jgi:transcriptional regulator with XRE-family HTH domain
LRREEVAQLANIGASWYVWLEQGRDAHPSPQVLESPSQAPKLTTNERRHLFLLAGQPLPPPSFPAEERLSPALQQVVHDLDPTPACVVGRRWDYLAWNRTADALFGFSAAEPPYAHDLLLQVVSDLDVWVMIYAPNAPSRAKLEAFLAELSASAAVDS